MSRLFLLLVLLVGSIAAPARAFAWVDLKVSSDDIRVTVEPSGKARVEHRVTLLVSGGPLKHVVLKGVDRDATVEPNGYVTLEKDAAHGDAGSVPISAERILAKNKDGSDADRTDLDIELDGGAGIKRGAWVLDIRYTTDLKATGALAKDGATYLLEWTGPSWDDGLDTTKSTFVFPGAPTPPRAADPADADDLGASAVLSSVKRDGTKDVLSLTRAYAPKGERVVWMMRVDGRAFVAEAEKAAAPPPIARPKPRFRGAKDTLLFGAGIGLVLLVAVLAALKSFEVKRLAAERGATLRALVPLPVLVRAPLAGIAFALGVALEMSSRSALYGALAVAAATLAIALRSPLHKAPLRGPGKWLSVNADEALRPGVRPRAYLDASTLAGKALFALLVGGAAVAAWFVSKTSTFDAALALLDTAPLFAVFFTGRLDQLPPDPAAAPVAFFRKVTRLFERRLPGARVVPRVRIPDGSADADELRLAIVPERPLRGLRSIEIAMSYAGGLGGYVAMPDVLVRCQSKSEADARVEAHSAYGRVTRGRKIDERVLVLAPKLPTARLTAELLVALAKSFSEGAKSPPAEPSQSKDAAAKRRVRIAPIAA